MAGMEQAQQAQGDRQLMAVELVEAEGFLEPRVLQILVEVR